MSEADDLIGRLYPDSLEERERLESIWRTFEMLDPRNGCYKFPSVKAAVNLQDRTKVTRPLRLGFFPDVSDEEKLQELFRQAMNRGISAVNTLIHSNLDNLDFDFSIDEISGDLDLLEYLSRGRKLWIDARNGMKGTPRPEFILPAYEISRSYDLGYRVLMIDEEPKVIESVRNFPLILDWFDELVAFRDEREEELEGFSRSWDTYAGVRVYGNEKPMKSRVKALDEEGGVKYSSLLVKMYLKQSFFDDIGDYTGIEFVVEDDISRRELVKLFKTDSKPTIKLEDFKDRSRKEDSHNPHSSSDFGNISFKVRAAVPVNYPGMEGKYERLPVEVQILTLEEDRIRRENVDVSHEAYKRKQFLQVFPAWFPRVIYEPPIRDHYS